jgi:hypothetical protein
MDRLASMAPSWQLDAEDTQTGTLISLQAAGVQLMGAHLKVASAVAAAGFDAAAIPYTLLPDSVVRQHLELLRLLPGLLRSLVEQRAAEVTAGAPQPPPGCHRSLTASWVAQGAMSCADLADALPSSEAFDDPSLQEVRLPACRLPSCPRAACCCQSLMDRMCM